ncbi:diguanylate cyclase [Rhodococcus sp. IEGM1300]
MDFPKLSVASNRCLSPRDGNHSAISTLQCLDSLSRRPYYLVARYGGEEFACVLPNTVLSGAVDIAEKMQKRVRALGIEHSASDVDRVMTISLRVATLTAAGEQGFEALIEAADKQLYEAKNAGRARVCSSAMSSS